MCKVICSFFFIFRPIFLKKTRLISLLGLISLVNVLGSDAAL